MNKTMAASFQAPDEPFNMPGSALIRLFEYSLKAAGMLPGATNKMLKLFLWYCHGYHDVIIITIMTIIDLW